MTGHAAAVLWDQIKEDKELSLNIDLAYGAHLPRAINLSGNDKCCAERRNKIAACLESWAAAMRYAANNPRD